MSFDDVANCFDVDVLYVVRNSDVMITYVYYDTHTHARKPSRLGLILSTTFLFDFFWTLTTRNFRPIFCYDVVSQRDRGHPLKIKPQTFAPCHSKLLPLPGPIASHYHGIMLV